MNEEEQKLFGGLYDSIEDSAIGKFFDLSGEKKAAVDQAIREGKAGGVSKNLQKVVDLLNNSVGAAMTPVTKTVEAVSDVTNIDERAVSDGLKALFYGKGLIKKVPKIQTPERFKPVNKRTVDVKADTVETAPMADAVGNIVPSKNFLANLKKRISTDIDRSGITGPLKIMRGDLIMDVTAGGSTNRPKTTPEQDAELMRRYEEINNPDSYVTDPLDPDFKKLKSSLPPLQQTELDLGKPKQLKAETVVQPNILTMGMSDEYINDPNDPNFGALKSEVDAASARYGTDISKGFYKKRQPDRVGRVYDLASGKFNVRELQRRFPGTRHQTFRREVQALASDERFTSVTFNKERPQIIADWFDGIEDLVDITPTKKLEIHHVMSIRHVGALMSGLNRADRARLNKVLLDNSTAVGHNPRNLIILDDKVHDRLHERLDEAIGKYAEKLIDPNKDYEFYEKVQIAKRMGEIVNRLTYEAYEEMGDFMTDKMTQASPAAAQSAAEQIAEMEASVDYALDQAERYMNQSGLTAIQEAIGNLPESETGTLPVDLEDQEAPKPTRLTRGPGKKTIERQKEFERIYGKQGELLK